MTDLHAAILSIIVTSQRLQTVKNWMAAVSVCADSRAVVVLRYRTPRTSAQSSSIALQIEHSESTRMRCRRMIRVARVLRFTDSETTKMYVTDPSFVFVFRMF